jgi:internalin A
MKKALFIIMVLTLALGAVACAPAAGTTELTTTSAVETHVTTTTTAQTPEPTTTTTQEPEAKTIVFNDAVLESRIREYLQKPEGKITVAEAEAVTFLDLSSADPWAPNEARIRDISALAGFKNLSSLYLRWNDIADLTPVAELTHLEALYLDGSDQLAEFGPLAGLTNIKDLEFSSNGGLGLNDSNIGFMANLTQMEILRIKGASELSDISPVANFPNLGILELLNCNIRDVSPIAGLGNLKELYLLGNPVSDFSPLKGIYANLEGKDFEILSADDVPEAPIAFGDKWMEAAVRQAMNITGRDITTRDAYLATSLDLSTPFDSREPRIKSIAELSYFKNLTVLSFDFQEISDISPLSGLTKLEKVSFNGNKVSDISALSGLNKLTHLDFFGNQVTDISALSGKTAMQAMSIFSNEISDISPLAGMTDLNMLRMENNQVSDIKVLSGLTSLRILMLAGNPVTDFSPVKDIYPQLGEKDFELK